MNKTILTPSTEAELLAFLPLARAREVCFLAHTRQDITLKDYMRAAYDDAQGEARSSFLPQRIRATFATPYATTKAFGLEGRVADSDGVQGGFRLPLGPVIEIEKIVFIDSSSVECETISSDQYRIEGGRFLRWNAALSWPTERPSFAVEYRAGITDATQLATIRVAVLELLAVKWDAKGGNYAVPTSARRVFHSMRGSRTRNPGA